MAPFLDLAGLAAVATAAVALVAVWRLRREAGLLSERLGEVSARLEAAEQDAARAALGSDVAESVLIDKGLADEEDLEEVRRQFRAQSAVPAYHPDRDGELH